MLLVTRERILVHILDVTRLTDMYQNHDPLYVAAVIDWLGKVEQTLQQLRHRLSGTVSAERGMLLAVGDGWRPPDVVEAKFSGVRKVERATASITLSTVVEKLDAAVADIDSRFDIVSEKLVQLLAVASGSKPLELAKPGESRNEWLQRLWENIPINKDTQSMYNYLQGALQRPDLLFLLGEAIDRILDR